MASGDTLNTGSYMQRTITTFDINDIKSLCIKHIPEWNQHRIGDLCVNRFHNGIMNYVFKVTSIKECRVSDVVFRIFDFDPKSTVDRQREDIAFEQAGRLGLGPKVLSRLKALAINGCRIEEYLPNDCFTRDGFFDQKLVANIGLCIGDFHSKMTGIFPDWNKVTELERCLNDWYNECISYPEHTSIFDSSKLKIEIENYLNELKMRMVTENYAYKIVVSHNDVLQFNILVRKDVDCVTLLDLEFVGYNFAGYDLACFIGASHLIFGTPKVFPFLSIHSDMVYPHQLTETLVMNYLNASGVSYDENFLTTFIMDLKFLELGWWLNRILFIATRSLKDVDQRRKDVMAEFSRLICKTYYYKKNYGISNNYFNY